MVFQAGLPFNFFEKPEVIAFLRVLNSAYVPPKATHLKTTMLDNTWKAVKINHQRICNISVTTRKGAFYYHNASLGPDTAGAAYTAEKVTEALNMITQTRLSRINSISADICSTMLGSFDQLSL
jgi:hypothetical protein